MKPSLRTALLLAAFAVAVLLATKVGAQVELCPGMPNGPLISNPAEASCVYDASSHSAVVTFNQATVLEWPQLRQGAESEMTFTFPTAVSNATVLNRLGRLSNGQMHRLDGTLRSNGRVIFLSPHAGLSLAGDLQAREFVAVASGVSASGIDGLLAGDTEVVFEPSGGTQGGGQLLTVSNARIEATGGDVVLGAARGVIISNTVSRPSLIVSQEATRIFAGDGMRYDPTISGGEQLSPVVGSRASVVSHSGRITAGTDVEIRGSESSELLITGPISAGEGGRIFLRVSEGRIDLNPQATLAGTLESTGSFSSLLLEGSSGDTPGASNPATSLFPSLRKEGATDRSGGRTKAIKVHRGAPVVANAGFRREEQARGNRERVRAAAEGQRRQTLVQRSGFFGLRRSEKPTQR
ncbi:hypothetical protein [Roseibacillus ishigakijimensis]|uniref:Auto-transporter adhesin head GIN domain-containing protein n=1 Tax=Roseibacillus ishigakijimensis TaxID=454146 RepID=A0A934RKI8_9BACT|nr:hypothetical protein [Roseibacillus ishigakijimensis]MBK1832538.1 hypothetical protein [Roseibacillus ishigakijimensis]